MHVGQISVVFSRSETFDTSEDDYAMVSVNMGLYGGGGVIDQTDTAKVAGGGRHAVHLHFRPGEVQGEGRERGGIGRGCGLVQTQTVHIVQQPKLRRAASDQHKQVHSGCNSVVGCCCCCGQISWSAPWVRLCWVESWWEGYVDEDVIEDWRGDLASHHQTLPLHHVPIAQP